MDLIQLLIALIVLGVILWAVESLIPLDATIKRVIQVVVILIVVIWLLSALGALPGGGHYIHIGGESR